METKEQVPARELLEAGPQVQTSSEPEVSSTQEDLFDQSSKTGRKGDCFHSSTSHLFYNFILVLRLLFKLKVLLKLAMI